VIPSEILHRSLPKETYDQLKNNHPGEKWRRAQINCANVYRKPYQ